MLFLYFTVKMLYKRRHCDHAAQVGRGPTGAVWRVAVTVL